MEIDENILSIICKKINSDLTTEEESALEFWRKKAKVNEDFLQLTEDRELLTEELYIWYSLLSKEENEGWQDRLSINVYSKISKKKPNKLRVIYQFLNNAKRVAALFIVLLFVGFVVKRTFFQQDVIEELKDVMPYQGQAYVKLSTGQLIVLDSSKNELIAGAELVYNDGMVLHKFGDENEEKVELSTTKGGRYSLTLSDGTKVWLNSGSRLVYPSKFKGFSRVVELEGEAYFDVKPAYVDGEKQGFIVKTTSQNIEVLGTEFNISAYKEAGNDVTTLVEGSVLIKAHEKLIFLKPGEQSLVSKDTVFKREIDVDVYRAWLRNVFYFYETPLEEALHTISRWYDVELVRSTLIPDTHLYGTISRDHSLKEVLQIIEGTGLKFTLSRVNGKKQLLVSNQ